MPIDTIPMTGPASVSLVALAIGVPVLVLAALHDVAARTIPDWTSIVLAALGLALRFAAGQLPMALILAVTVFAACAFCCLRGWLGGGDVKLLAACTLLVPPTGVFGLLCDTMLAGGVVALVYLVGRTRGRRHAAKIAPRPTGLLARLWRCERHRFGRGGPLPYGSAIAAGTMVVLFAPVS